MLPLAFRLKRRSDFSRVYSRGRSCATDLIVVYVLPAPVKVRGLEPRAVPELKIGFSVGKKLGGAAARNRVRRLLREAVRPFLLRLKPGYNMIVLARARAGAAQLSDFTAALGTAFARLGVLNAGDH